LAEWREVRSGYSAKANSPSVKKVGKDLNWEIPTCWASAGPADWPVWSFTLWPK